jgi:signal transduction histidine kinase
VVTAQRVEASTLSRRVEAAENERARWARELHDESLQDLAGLKILLAAGRRRDAGDLPLVVDEAIVRLSQSIESLRGLIADLRPAALDQLGVGAALDGLAERTRSGAGLQVELHVDIDESRLPPDTASTVYRLVQESLTNVAKHAQAASVAVRVEMGPGSVTIEVRDDGIGFDPTSPAAGFGLVGMRERAELEHGSLDVETSAGTGTIVRVLIPLDAADDEDAAAGPAA